jgi:hypothetical protein
MWLVLIYVLLCVWLFVTYKTHLEIHDSIPFYSEDGVIDHIKNERSEQLIINKYIDSSDNVLELGTRYGTVSCLLARKANRVVSLDPDIDAIRYASNNMANHGVYFESVHGIVSTSPQIINRQGYGTTTSTAELSDIPNYTILQLEDKFNIKFNTLVADCEGCLEKVINENDISKFSKIIYEEDQPGNCNYKNIANILISNGFTLVETVNEIISHCIWIKHSV